MRLKVLISAYACEPGRGSEPGVGWNVVRGLSARHDLHVITRANNEPAIVGAKEAWTSRVQWEFLDLPESLRRWKNHGPLLPVYYLLWQRAAGTLARELIGRERFDVVHHLTFGNFLPVSPLSRLGIPFVAGPLGGGESMPPAYLRDAPIRVKLLELKRSIIRRIGVCAASIHGGYRGAMCLAATPQTEAVLRQVGAGHVEVTPQSGIGADDARVMAALDGGSPGVDGRLRLVTASRLVHWKAVDLAVEALATATRRGLDADLTILQGGPDEARLRALVRRLGISDRVSFAGRLGSLREVYGEIAGADALLHPALHEAFGQVCLESLALGVPVICLDWAGPGLIVDETCGWKVRPGSREEVVGGLARAMEALRGILPIEGARLAACCRDRAACFSWDRNVAAIDQAYRAAAMTGSPA